jgi:hypothetical protein
MQANTIHDVDYDETTDPMPSAQCQSCGEVWFMLTGEGGRRPRRWWACPNHCNA